MGRATSTDFDESSLAHWYLLRTKVKDELRVSELLRPSVHDVLIPLAQSRTRRRSEVVPIVSALFPGYIFVFCDLSSRLNLLRYTRGVRELVSFGGRPAIVPDGVIAEINILCSTGPVELLGRDFVSGQPVEVVEGPLRNFEGIFERYVSGRERIVILMSAMGAGARVVLPVESAKAARETLGADFR